MKSTKLTPKQKKEKLHVTIGRLRTAIKYGTQERQLALLEKISEDCMRKGMPYPELGDREDKEELTYAKPD